MQAGDYGERRSEPWTYRKRALPLRTYSGKVVYRHTKNRFTMRDVERILAKVEPKDTEDPDSWVDSVMAFLRGATIEMLRKLMPFLDRGEVEDFYSICIDILDQFFQIDAADEQMEGAARRLMVWLADRFGLTITIKK